MTANHLLLNRLAELMLEKENHILLVDDLFDDQIIGHYIKSIQIDSPYQQMIFEGVVTESVKEEKLYVSFTVEGYFHYVLGELVWRYLVNRGVDALVELMKENKLKGLCQAVEHSLVLCVENNQLSFIKDFIYAKESFRFVLNSSLSYACFVKSSDFVIKNLFEKIDDDIIPILIDLMNKFKNEQKYSLRADFSKSIISITKPDTYLRAQLLLECIEVIEISKRKEYLNLIANGEFLDLFVKDKDIGDFFYAIGNQYGNISDFENAIVYFDKAIEFKKIINEENHSSFIEYYNSLGAAKSYQGHYLEGVSFYSRALEISLNLNGDLHHSTARSYNNLGTCLYDLGNYINSVDELSKSLRIRLKIFGKYHPDTAKSYNSLGMVSKDQGNLDLALDYHLNALNIRINLFGELHPSVAVSYSNIGAVWIIKCDYNKAIDYFNKSLFIRRHNFGELHNDVAVSYNNLAAAYSFTEKRKNSIEYFEKSAQIWGQIFSQNHPHVASCYNNIGSIYSNEKNYSLALLYFEKCLKIRLKVLGKMHPNTGLTYSNLATLYFDFQEFGKAISYFKKSLRIEKKMHGYLYSSFDIIYFKIGVSFYSLKEFSKAIRALKKGMKINPNSGGFPFWIAGCQEKIDQNKKALFYYIKSAELRRKQLSPQHESTRLSIQKCIEVNSKLEKKIKLPTWFFA